MSSSVTIANQPKAVFSVDAQARPIGVRLLKRENSRQASKWLMKNSELLGDVGKYLEKL